MRQWLNCTNTQDSCCMVAHLQCFAKYFLEHLPKKTLIPKFAICPECGVNLEWPILLTTLKEQTISNNDDEIDEDPNEDASDDANEDSDLSQIQSQSQNSKYYNSDSD